jgi:hypothetical protein
MLTSIYHDGSAYMWHEKLYVSCKVVAFINFLVNCSQNKKYVENNCIYDAYSNWIRVNFIINM